MFEKLIKEDVHVVDQLLIELHARKQSFYGVNMTPKIFDFFEGLERQGLRVYSSELNYNPCVTAAG